MRILLSGLMVIVLLMVGITDQVSAHPPRTPFGPLHEYLYRTAPYPWLQDEILHCESGWDPGAYNPSGASGIAQFMPRTWAWGEQLYGEMGTPWDPYAAIDMMNAFARDGMLTHWSCFWIITEGWNPDGIRANDH